MKPFNAFQQIFSYSLIYCGQTLPDDKNQHSIWFILATLFNGFYSGLIFFLFLANSKLYSSCLIYISLHLE